jgi:hypothetical protein
MEGTEGLNSSVESIERPMWHYIYSNNELPGHPVIFECDAFDIIKADDLYEERLGIRPERENHIGCSIVKI